MNIKILLTIPVLLACQSLAAQQDTVQTAAAAAVDSTEVNRQMPPAVPVDPVRTIGKVAAIDTLPTGNDALRIVLFNDNTWRYVLSQDYVQDTTVFADHWNTSSIHAYNDVELSSLPEAAAIMLVDSLKSYHYPYLGRMSSRYGLRRGRPHQGVDLPLKTGDPIYAAFDGKVRYSGYNGGGYGNLVVIRHTNGLETYYGHLSERGVEAGDWVVAGQQIGLGGSTGRSSGPHLHFEVRYKGQSFDPERVIDFDKGQLRRDELLLKRRHFSIYSKFGQNFDDEEANEKQDEAERKAAAAVQYHTIRKGDTLGHIARKYHTSVKRICQLNGIKETTILRLGKRLRVR